MDNDTDYQELLQRRYFYSYLSSSIFIVLCALIGITGNFAIIFFYFFRIKERGERYFIPLLAIVDLVACFTSPPFYIIDNTFFFNYPSDTACRILSFLQTCVPGASAHILLVISIQRYLLVCKPFGPKMTLIWKRVFFGVVCGLSVAYSAPLLWTAGVLESIEIFMDHNVTIKICKFSVDSSPTITVYFGFLTLIMLANLFITAGLYVPVLKRVRRSFLERSRKTEAYREEIMESSCATQTTEAENGSVDSTNNVKDSKVIQLNERKLNIPTNNCQETVRKSSSNISENGAETNVSYPGSTSNKKSRTKLGSVQRRVTWMFFVIIVAYVFSYIPPLVILILVYTIEDFNFITLSEAQTLAWLYFARFVFLNQIINPFIYGYFDTKFRNKLRICCRRRNTKTFNIM
ncbi:cholecystokinin receptor type A-like [Saccostrea echinata]|uniref:cholecystokinin receptor type A-like n=1 Tax=Saccostrea echinata TaxID=191078 RepID=UPI002A823171|nr:cholecystokinin receptor type A-like [Saccostrea echinata]